MPLMKNMGFAYSSLCIFICFFTQGCLCLLSWSIQAVLMLTYPCGHSVLSLSKDHLCVGIYQIFFLMSLYPSAPEVAPGSYIAIGISRRLFHLVPQEGSFGLLPNLFFIDDLHLRRGAVDWEIYCRAWVPPADPWAFHPENPQAWSFLLHLVSCDCAHMTAIRIFENAIHLMSSLLFLGLPWLPRV